MAEAVNHGNYAGVRLMASERGGKALSERAGRESFYPGEQFPPPPVEPVPPPRPSRGPRWLPVALALIVGIALGVLVMRQRNHGHRYVAAVNGAVITQDDLFNRLQTVSGPAVMHKMVEEELQLQFAKKLGVAPTSAQVDAQFDEDSQAPGFLQELAAKGMSIDDYKHFLRINLAQEAVITRGVSVSDAEAREFYATQIDKHNPAAQFYRPDTVTFRIIGTSSRVDIQNAARSLAENTPFDLVAGTYSKDPSKDNGGLLPPLQRGRSPLSQLPDLEQEAFNLPVGKRLGPVAYKGQWMILQCENKEPGGVIPYAQVKAKCRREARLQKGLRLNKEAIQAQFAEFQRTASIQAFWPQYDQAVHGN